MNDNLYRNLVVNLHDGKVIVQVGNVAIRNDVQGQRKIDFRENVQVFVDNVISIKDIEGQTKVTNVEEVILFGRHTAKV